MQGAVISSLFGQGLPQDAALGRIHSVFKNSINVLVGEELLHIGRIGDSLSAYGVNLPPEKLQRLLAECHEGDLVKSEGNYLRVYARKEVLTLWLGDARKVDLSIPKLNCSPDQSLLYQQLQLLDFSLLIGLPWDRQLMEHAKLLAENQAPQSEKEAKEVLGFFVGRGKGLTPSGDDILIGFLAVLTAMGFQTRWCEYVWPLVAGQTTDVSVAYYKALLQGYISEDLKNLLLGLEEQDIAKLQQLITKVQKLGHTSGNDVLFGIWLGLQACIACSHKKQEGKTCLN